MTRTHATPRVPLPQREAWRAPRLLAILLLLSFLATPASAVTRKKPAKAATSKAKNKAKARPSATRTTSKRKSRPTYISPQYGTAAAESAQATLAETPPHPFLYPHALEPFFRSLAAQRSQKTSPTARSTIPELAATVRILQFGDSHTAADLFTGELRAQLQSRFGNGGLGFQYPGHPFAGYHLAGSTRSQTSGWFTEGNKFTQLGDGNLGLGGISISTSRPGESITLSTTCSTLQVHFLRQPEGGHLRFTDNGTFISDIATATPDTASAGQTTPASQTTTPGAPPSPTVSSSDKVGSTSAGQTTTPGAPPSPTVSSSDKVGSTSASNTSAGQTTAPGAPPSPTVSSSDKVGSTATSAGTVTYACTSGLHDFQFTTLEHAPVKLLGLVTEQPGITYECLGINGAVAPLMLRWNPELFSEYLRQRDPNLIVLAYGTNEAAQGPGTNAEYVAQFHRLLQTLHSIVPGAAILVLGPYDRATRVGRGRRASWQTWGGTERIIADQKEACRVDHCAFYDARTRMGGPGSMSRWVAAGYAQPDRTHLTGTGYRALADALARDLIEAVRTFQQTQPSTPNP